MGAPRILKPERAMGKPPPRATRSPERQQTHSKDHTQDAEHKSRDGDRFAVVELGIVLDLNQSNNGEDQAQEIERQAVATEAAEGQDAQNETRQREGIRPLQRHRTRYHGRRRTRRRWRDGLSEPGREFGKRPQRLPLCRTFHDRFSFSVGPAFDNPPAKLLQ